MPTSTSQITAPTAAAAVQTTHLPGESGLNRQRAAAVPAVKCVFPVIMISPLCMNSGMAPVSLSYHSLGENSRGGEKKIRPRTALNRMTFGTLNFHLYSVYSEPGKGNEPGFVRSAKMKITSPGITGKMPLDYFPEYYIMN